MVSAEPTALRNQQLNQAQSELGTFWHRARSAKIVERLSAIGAGEVVDVGAGAGHLGGWLARYRPAVRYRFLEPMPDLCDLLVTRFGAENLVRNSGEIGHADAVTMLDVLEHIEDDAGFLADLFANMAPGTELLLTVPANQWLFSDWDTQLGHHRRYGRRDLRSVLEGAGFDVASTTHLFPELLPPAMLRKIKRAGTGDGSAEFPQLPEAVDRLAYGLCRATSTIDRIVPFGTSLLAVARRP